MARPGAANLHHNSGRTKKGKSLRLMQPPSQRAEHARVKASGETCQGTSLVPWCTHGPDTEISADAMVFNIEVK